mgnify:CR=1 FL=1
MSGPAQVRSTHAIEEFREALARFERRVQTALDGLDSQMRRAHEWVELVNPPVSEIAELTVGAVATQRARGGAGSPVLRPFSCNPKLAEDVASGFTTKQRRRGRDLKNCRIKHLDPPSVLGSNRLCVMPVPAEIDDFAKMERYQGNRRVARRGLVDYR